MPEEQRSLELCARALGVTLAALFAKDGQPGLPDRLPKKLVELMREMDARELALLAGLARGVCEARTDYGSTPKSGRKRKAS